MINRRAVDDENALVALAHLVQITLHHQCLQAVRVHRVQNRVGVLVALGQLENAAAAHAVQRFRHRLAELAQEGENLAARLRHQRLRRALRQAGDGKLLVHVAQRLRRIDHPHPLRLQQIEHIRIIDIAQIEGRVLTLQQHIDLAQINHFLIQHAEIILILIIELHRAYISLHRTVAHLPVALAENHHPVAERLGGEH